MSTKINYHRKMWLQIGVVIAIPILMLMYGVWNINEAGNVVAFATLVSLIFLAASAMDDCPIDVSNLFYWGISLYILLSVIFGWWWWAVAWTISLICAVHVGVLYDQKLETKTKS